MLKQLTTFIAIDTIINNKIVSTLVMLIGGERKMKKGISPIVAVVLLIAIAVIAAVGLYFWVGSLTNKPATPTQPGMLTAQAICGDNQSSTTTFLLTNIGTSTVDISTLKMTAPKDSSAQFNASSDCASTTIQAGGTIKCNITNFGKGSGTATFYGTNIGTFAITC